MFYPERTEDAAACRRDRARSLQRSGQGNGVFIFSLYTLQVSMLDFQV